jgi:hypothetical protein
MIVLDFLFYYLTFWFNKNKDKLSWSTPIQRSTYVVGLMTMGLLFSINEFFELKHIAIVQFHISKLFFVLGALATMKLYDYIYISNNRYEKIFTVIPQKFSISDDTGATICIIIAGFCILSPFIVSTFLIPFGGHTIAFVGIISPAHVGVITNMYHRY